MNPAELFKSKLAEVNTWNELTASHDELFVDFARLVHTIRMCLIIVRKD